MTDEPLEEHEVGEQVEGRSCRGAGGGGIRAGSGRLVPPPRRRLRQLPQADGPRACGADPACERAAAERAAARARRPRAGARGRAEHEEAKLEEGVRLVHRSLLGLVERHGLTEIDTEGAFDPHVHEALLAQPGEGAEEGSVLQVLQKGYRLGDKVIRPARVIVAE